MDDRPLVVLALASKRLLALKSLALQIGRVMCLHRL